MDYADYVALAYEAYLERLWEERCAEHDRMMYVAMEEHRRLEQEVAVALDVVNGAEASVEVQAWAVTLLEATGVLPAVYPRSRRDRGQCKGLSRSDGRARSYSSGGASTRPVSHTQHRFGSQSGRGESW
jgi:hypothetical protein